MRLGQNPADTQVISAMLPLGNMKRYRYHAPSFPLCFERFTEQSSSSQMVHPHEELGPASQWMRRRPSLAYWTKKYG